MYCEKRNLFYETATDGFEAINKYKEAAATEPINLILLDLQMPNCDGIQACKAIREFEKEKNITPAAIFIGKSRLKEPKQETCNADQNKSPGRTHRAIDRQVSMPGRTNSTPNL